VTLIELMRADSASGHKRGKIILTMPGADD